MVWIWWHWNRLNKRLVNSFLKNSKVLLRKEGEIHVAHKKGEPYSKWDLVGIAEEIGLVLHDVVPFYKDEYPGYRNKRGHGSCPDAQFNLGDCSTYKFRLNHSPLLNFDEQVWANGYKIGHNMNKYSDAKLLTTHFEFWIFVFPVYESNKKRPLRN